MRILTINVNGIRSFKGWSKIESLNPDVICIQELKCDASTAKSYLSSRFPEWNIYVHSSRKKGYSGVATISKFEASQVEKNQSSDDYLSGRILKTRIEGFNIFNVYSQNSGAGKLDKRVQFEYELEAYLGVVQDPIVVGDMNVAPYPIDCPYWETGEAAKIPGLRKTEIQLHHRLKERLELFDAFRMFHPNETQYSWFSFQDRGHSRMRLDMFLVPIGFLTEYDIQCTIADFRVSSDHVPVWLDL